MNINYFDLRAIKLIKQIIKNLDLDLNNQIVLTEVGSKYYKYTPIIAALAGAKKVYAIARDNSYGKGEDNIIACIELCSILDIKNIIFHLNYVPTNIINEADIITNSGNLRPLDKFFLSKTKKDVVISLMYEKWEYRKSDVDVDWCISNNIKVAGVWESHPQVNVFNFVGQLAIKLVHEAGFEVFDNKIIVWSNDNFGDTIKQAFLDSGASDVLQTIEINKVFKSYNNYDFIFICHYNENRKYFGQSGVFDVKDIISQNPSIGIIHLYGDVDYDFLDNMGVNCFPRKKGEALHMSETLGYLGLKPIIKLQVAGLKVAQMLKNNQSGELVQLF
jgi:hypothetical protein